MRGSKTEGHLLKLFGREPSELLGLQGSKPRPGARGTRVSGSFGGILRVLGGSLRLFRVVKVHRAFLGI